MRPQTFCDYFGVHHYARRDYCRSSQLCRFPPANDDNVRRNRVCVLAISLLSSAKQLESHNFAGSIATPSRIQVTLVVCQLQHSGSFHNGGRGSLRFRVSFTQLHIPKCTNFPLPIIEGFMFGERTGRMADGAGGEARLLGFRCRHLCCLPRIGVFYESVHRVRNWISEGTDRPSQVKQRQLLA